MTAQIKRPKGGKDWPRTVTYGSCAVKVYRVAHKSNRTGWAYVLVWTTADGRETKKFADPDRALDEARLKVARLSAGQIGAAGMSVDDREALQSARLIVGNDAPLFSAMREWREAFDLTGGHVLLAAREYAARNLAVARERVTVATVIDEFLKKKTKDGFLTASSQGYVFRSLGEAFGALQIDSVSALQISAYLDGIENTVSRNTYRKRIVTLWRWAQRKGYLPRDLLTEAEQTDAAREEAPKIGIITAKTFAALLTLVRTEQPEHLPALVLAGFCGLRRIEIHGQRWADIDLKGRHVRVTTAKRGTPAGRLVPLCDAAVAWLRLAPDKTEWICSTNRAMTAIRRLGAKHGIELPANALRHSYISFAVAESGDIPRVSLNAGTSVGKIHRHYRLPVAPAEGRAWFNIRPAKHD